MRPNSGQINFEQLLGTVMSAAKVEQLQESIAQAQVPLHRLKKDTSTVNSLSSDLKKKARALGLRLNSEDDYQELLSAAQKWLAALPTLTIIAPVEVSQIIEQDIQNTLEQDGPADAAGHPLALRWRTKVNPRLIGGIVIEWQGRRLDYSLARIITDQYVARNV